MKYIDFDEPFKKLIHQGTITNSGTKMSKSKGNVVNPDEFINNYGSDTFRMYMMFMGSYEDGGDWNDEGITGIYRFLNRIHRLVDSFIKTKPTGNEKVKAKEIDRIKHYTIKKVTNDIERFQFNTAISRLMEFYNSIIDYRTKLSNNEQNKEIICNSIETIIKLLAPFSPHLSEELWKNIGNKPSIFHQKWPNYQEDKLVEDKITIVVQVNGKLRDQLNVDINSEKAEILEKAKKSEKVQKYINDCQIIKKIYVPKKLVNFVIKT